MGRYRFVRPETVVLPLEGGDSITVKKYLNAGEHNDRMVRGADPDPDRPGYVKAKPGIEYGLATACAYLVDWTLADEEGQVIPIRGLPAGELEGILRMLEATELDLVIDRIFTHQNAMKAAREEQKKTAGPSELSKNSALPAAVGGGMSG